MAIRSKMNGGWIGRMAWAAVLAALMASGAQAASTDAAYAAYQKGDYAKAMSLLKPLAAAGDAKAEYSLGAMYENALGVPANAAEAARWLGRSAAQGNVLAEVDLASLYQRGLGVTKDYAQAMRLYRQAADKGEAVGDLGVGVLYDQGLGVPADAKQAADWYRKAAEGKDS